MNWFAKIITKMRLTIRRVNRFLGIEIWRGEPEPNSWSKTKARLASDTRVVMRVMKTFQSEKIGFQSVALSYFCTLAAIPFIAVAFALTSGFGMEDKMEAILLSAKIDPELSDKIMQAAQNIIDTSQNGWFGLISGLMFVWVIIWMMNRVERVFNNVWRIQKPPRKFFKSLGVDIIILILLPFIVMIFAYGTMLYSHFADYVFPNWIGATKAIRSFLGWVIFCIITIFTLSGMYKFIPATKVYYRHAFKAALLAGIAFTILQYLYLETQILVMRINMVYGAIAIIPLFMIWLRFGWLIILYGAEFSYSFQKEEASELNKALKERKDKRRKQKMRDKELAEV
jgi:membrane protein